MRGEGGRPVDDAERPTRPLREWFDGLAGLLFPAACLACDATTRGRPFCTPCAAELLDAAAPSCPRCAMPVGPWANVAGGCAECRGRPLGFDAATALGPYQGPIRAACLKMKGEHGAWIAPWLADLIVQARGERLRAEGDAVVVPVPLHWRRSWRRGYNQSEALALGLAGRLGRPLVRALKRVVATPPLARLGRARRADLLRGAFRVRSASHLQGRSVFLVDDILTTGATCGAAARALKQAGARRVTAVVVARAEGLT
jgi:ComF family protein